LNGPCPMVGLGALFHNTVNGGRYGQEEKSQEGSKEKEKEESSRKQRKKEIVEETREKSGQEKGEAENGKESRDETGSSDGGIDDYDVIDGGDARRGENRPEPRGRMAVSDGLQALAGDESSCARSEVCASGWAADLSSVRNLSRSGWCWRVLTMSLRPSIDVGHSD
jgi:hypothetical protein